MIAGARSMRYERERRLSAYSLHFRGVDGKGHWKILFQYLLPHKLCSWSLFSYNLERSTLFDPDANQVSPQCNCAMQTRRRVLRRAAAGIFIDLERDETW